MKKIFLVVCALIFSTSVFAADKPLKVVSSTTLAAELMRKIGGEHVKVDSIASPKFNIHFIQPTPNHVRKTAHADLFVFYGLDLEAWADPLLAAAGNPKLFRGDERNLDLSVGIRLLKVPTGNLTRAAGDLHIWGNPHYAMNPENLLIMAETACAKLVEIDSVHAVDYRKNTDAFKSKLSQKISEWKIMSSVATGKEIISYHDDLTYLADFMGFENEMFLEPKPGIPPTPKHLAELEVYGHEHHVRAIAVASYQPRRSAEKLAKRIGAQVVAIAQSPGEIKGTENIFDFYEHNVRALSEVLK